MSEQSTTRLILQPEAIPDTLRTWLNEIERSALLVSLELLDDGRLVIQALPDVDPSLVARVRRTMAQHEDVLRRLS